LKDKGKGASVWQKIWKKTESAEGASEAAVGACTVISQPRHDCRTPRLSPFSSGNKPINASRKRRKLEEKANGRDKHEKVGAKGLSVRGFVRAEGGG